MRCLFFFLLLLLPLNTAYGADPSQPSQPLQLLNPQIQGQQAQNGSGQEIMQAEIRDITGPLELPENNLNWIFLAVAAILLIVLFIYLLLRWKKNRAVSVKTPAELAMEEMALAKPLFEEGNLILYAEKITEVLRTFITRQFGITVTSRTTHEFLQHIQQSREQDSPLYGHRESLGDCLRQVDLVKFAKLSPDQSIVQTIESTVTSFIQESSVKKEEN